MAPVFSSRKSGVGRPAASVYAVCMSLTAVVRLIGVGGAWSAANTWPTTWGEVAYPVASVRQKPVMKLSAAGLKLELEMVEGAIDSLKVAWMPAFSDTPVAFESGLVEAMVGGVTSAAALVVKDQTWLAARAFPARSVAPVVTVAVNTVLCA